MSVYPANFWKNPVNWLAFGLGSGRMRQAPGTWGTLAALPFAFAILQLSPMWQAVIIGVSFVAGCWICHYSSQKLGVHDHSGIVWDEFVGLWITLFMVPAQWGILITGFVLFRIFDIMKPWPINWIDKRVHGGIGIMLDDVLAGVMAWGVLQFILYYRWL